MDIYIVQRFTDAQLADEKFFLNEQTAQSELKLANKELQEQTLFYNSPMNKIDSRTFVDKYEKWNYFKKFKYSLKWYEIPTTIYKLKKGWVNEN